MPTFFFIIPLTSSTRLFFPPQLTGQVNILYYTPYVIHAMGITSLPADVLISSTIGIVKALGTLAALFMVDAIGRRKLLTLGPVLMITGAVLMSSALLFDARPRSHDELRCTEGSAGNSAYVSPANQTQINYALQTTTIYLSGAVIYIGAYSVSFAPGEAKSKRVGHKKSIN